MEKKPEILAPVGSEDGLKAVIAAGCDAVYIGGVRFGARAYADNFSEEKLCEAIRFCHLHGVKLYLTVNTLLKEREIDQLAGYLAPYYREGLDAVIVQDMGALRLISRHFPDLAIHASTQMALTMGAGMKRLEPYHVKRLVPARELTLQELRTLRQDTQAEIEVFVHGALCYCYSGQCLFSSMAGERSGNRGRCAQPCRMPYQLEGGDASAGKYLLSPKELSNLPYLGELIEAGVDSLKIEGRMKRPEYAAFLTALFRKYVDLYASLGKEAYQGYIEKNRKEWEEDWRKAAELYNRNGFTQGYLEGMSGSAADRAPGQKKTMLSAQRPKHGGVLVGTVTAVNSHQATYRALKDLSAQDVVEFRDSQMQPVYEYTLGSPVRAGENVTARYQKGCKIHIGDSLYRTKDAALLEEIREDYFSEPPQAEVSGIFRAKEGQAACLSLKLGDVCTETWGDVCQAAKSQPTAAETVRKALCQTGTALFSFGKLEIAIGGSPFLPVGALKKLRRQAFADLEEKIAKKYQRNGTGGAVPGESSRDGEDQNERQNGTQGSEVENPARAESHPEPRQSTVSASVMDLRQLRAVLERPEICRIYLQTEILSFDEIGEAFRLAKQAGLQVWLVMPRIFRARVWQGFEQEYFGKNRLFSLEWDGFLVKNQESLSFLADVVQSDSRKIRLDSEMYVMNREAVSFWREQGIALYTLPFEETERELLSFVSPCQAELVVYGRLALMVSAQCIQANLYGCAFDRPEKWAKSHIFYGRGREEYQDVNYCKYCYNVIYQTSPLDIRECLEREAAAGMDMRYSFTTETAAQVREVLGGGVRNAHRGHFERGVR